MTTGFRPEALRGAGGRTGEVDFRLARTHAVREYKRGRLSRNDVCDAHPELLRAARNVGTATRVGCPICEDAAVVHVTYVFGARLPSNGRVISAPAELTALQRRPDELTGYTVEVCPACGWNHLSRTFPVGRRQPRRT